MILPLTLLAAFLGAVLLSGRRRGSVMVLALTIVFIASWPPTTWLAVSTLEGWYKPAMPPSAQPTEAIVVLSGYMKETDWGGLPIPGLDTYERLTYAFALHERWPEVPIIVTGGRLLGEEHPSVARVMADYLVRQGVPDALITEEPEARNTHENARNTAELLRSLQLHTVALVTEARHMLRAELSFTAQGIDVLPAPCCFASDIDEWEWNLLSPSWWTLQTMEGTFHEWLGLLAYKLRGWI